MPLKQCNQDGKPGFKWGEKGACYTYTPGDADSMMAAKKKAIKQAIAMREMEAAKEKDDVQAQET